MDVFKVVEILLATGDELNKYQISVIGHLIKSEWKIFTRTFILEGRLKGHRLSWLMFESPNMFQ